MDMFSYDSDRTSLVAEPTGGDNHPSLTVNEAGRIVERLQQNAARFDSLNIRKFRISDDAVSTVLRNGLAQCTSLTTVSLENVCLGQAGFEPLVPVFYNTSITNLTFGRAMKRTSRYGLHTERGSEAVRALLEDNHILLELHFNDLRLDAVGARGLGQGMSRNSRLQKLTLNGCRLTNQDFASITSSFLLSSTNSTMHASLEFLDLEDNEIENADGGHQVTLLLRCFPHLKELILSKNLQFGPLGAAALAPGLAAATHLKIFKAHRCRLGNVGVANLCAKGQVMSSLTDLEIGGNDIRGEQGRDNVMALISRCPNLERIRTWSPRPAVEDRDVNSFLERRRICNEARALAGSPFPILLQALHRAHGQEHGLDVIFTILQNDGDYHFTNALVRD